MNLSKSLSFKFRKSSFNVHLYHMHLNPATTVHFRSRPSVNSSSTKRVCKIESMDRRVTQEAGTARDEQRSPTGACMMQVFTSNQVGHARRFAPLSPAKSQMHVFLHTSRRESEIQGTRSSLTLKDCSRAAIRTTIKIR